MQRTDGYEEWELACWDKKPLMDIMKIPDFEMELISIEKKEGTNLFLPQIQPKISTKQNQAIKLAIKKEY